MEYTRDKFIITDDRNKVQINEVHRLLRDSYWASDRDKDTIKTTIENSVCFSLFTNGKQIGFARVVTDFASVAYLADVIIDSYYRRQGLGKWLLETVLNDPRWSSKFKFLATDDAHKLYEKYGFSGSNKLMSTAI